MATIMLVMIPKRNVPCVKISNSRPTSVTGITTFGRLRGMTTSGSGSASTAPRLGSERPETNSTAMTIRNGSASPIPVLAHDGHQVFVPSSVASDWIAPRARPAAITTPMYVSRPTRAHANAGTTMSVKPMAFRPVDGVARMKSKATTTEEISHVVAARNCGENLANDAARSFSAAARVARPIRVNRK